MHLGAPRRRSKAPLFIVLFVVLSAVGYAGWATLRVGARPQVSIEPQMPAIGPRTPLEVSVSEPLRGVSSVRVELVQGETVERLGEAEFTPQPAWKPWGTKTATHGFSLEVGKQTLPKLKNGTAKIRVTAGVAGTWFLTPEPVVEEKELPVRLTPPSLSVMSTQIHVMQGGSEVVVYEVGETSAKDGVRAGDWFFPGYPLPKGGANQRFAFFSAPYHGEANDEIRLVTQDELGNENSIPFIDTLKAKPYRKDTINVSKNALQKMVPKVMAESPDFEDQGDLVKNYVAINSKMRRQNDQKLVELAKQTKPEFYWNEPFVQMPGQVFSSFADRRTYRYDGEEIDQQFHLGFDIASVKRADIPAANGGVIVFAGPLGIYGKAVVVDHGYGLMSLYGHLSSIGVKIGQRVKRGEPLGATGETGLALGDHLHFTMLLHGLAVTPMEWWDSHWIQDRLALKLEDALEFVGSGG